MNENVFREILEESFRREYAQFDSVPKHKFSLKHRLAMKRIIARFDKNKLKITGYEFVCADPHYSLKRRLLVALVVIILMTLLTGWFIPVHRLTDVQVDWLRSRYDFANMKIRITDVEPDGIVSAEGYSFFGMYHKTAEYMGFIADLTDLGIYSEDELMTIESQAAPLDTRPTNLREYTAKQEYTAVKTKLGISEERPIDSVTEYVEELEKELSFYEERSKDPSRVVEGDAEFAVLIKNNFLPLPKSFLELLKKLYADPANDDSAENQKSLSLNFAKDDKIKLFKINKF